MLNELKKHPVAFTAALLLHVLIALLFMVSFHWTKKPEPIGNKIPIVLMTEIPKPSADQGKPKEALDKPTKALKQIPQ